jgi:hypothetical protein
VLIDPQDRRFAACLHFVGAFAVFETHDRQIGAAWYNAPSPTRWTNGKSQPERKSYYEAVAKTLREAGQVLVFGSGTGKSSAMEMLLADLKDHHPDVAAKVIGSVVVDAHHTTEDQLLAQAREFYAEYNRK